MTGRDAITAALRLIGALAPGESLDATEATDGLATLNRMISSWSNEGLMIHAISRETPLTLTVSDGTITMGASGNITNRAQKIEAALIRDESSTPAVEFPVRILSIDEWAAIPSKDSEATYPTDLYDDGAYPQRILYLYPVPSAAHKLVLFTRRILTEIATLDTSISLPPGYEEAIVFNLCIRFAPEYGKSVSGEVATIANESKAAIKKANSQPAYLRVDDALLPSGGRFNIYTGGS
jgi:hypothetical protein